jgi:putative Mg2+ transporter-C (MgtC) family protein
VVSGIGFLGGGVILRDGFHVRGLNTAATLWCSAAVGVLAASGHLVFALVGTATVLAVHLLGRPLGQLIDHDNPAAEEEDLRPYELHITCKPKSEPRIRALLVQDASKSEVVLTGIDATRTDDGAETRLTAHLLVGGDPAQLLEELVARISLEPGIRAVHWHSADQLEAAPVLAVPEPEPAPSVEETTG